MPWQIVNEINNSIILPRYTATVPGTTSPTIYVGNRSDGDIFDVVCNFPTGVVHSYYAFNPVNATNVEVVHVSVDPDNDQAVIRLRATQDGLTRGRFNFVFDVTQGSTAPNYTIRILHN